MSHTINILIIIIFFYFHAIFAMYEIAMVSARKTRLQQRSEEGSRGAAIALGLLNDPNQQFMSTVQVMITLIDTLSGGIGGAVLSEPLAGVFVQLGLNLPFARTVSLFLVVVAITYCSIVFGELIPKRLAFSKPEEMAIRLSPLIQGLTGVLRPLTRLLSGSTNLGIKILKIDTQSEPSVTEYDVKVMIAEGKEIGVFEQAEQAMVSAVFRLGDRRVDSFMTPRTEVDWVNLDDDPNTILETLQTSEFYRLPVARGNLDEVTGMLDVRDLVGVDLHAPDFQIEKFVQPPLFIPESVSALKALELFRKFGMPNAFVIDEYGGFQGVVTFHGVFEIISGSIPADLADQPEQAIRRADGSWLIDGLLQVDEVKEILHLSHLPGEEKGEFQTLGGFVMSRLGSIPKAGQSFKWKKFRFEVVDMDGRRVDKVLVAPLTDEARERTPEPLDQA